MIERHAHSRVEIMVKAKSQFKRRSTANNVEIMIPVPNDADSPKFKTTIGENVSKPKAQSKASPGLGHVLTVHWELKTVLYCTITLPRPVQVRAGGGRGVLDHQVIPRRQGVSHEGDDDTICILDSTDFVYKYANI